MPAGKGSYVWTCFTDSRLHTCTYQTVFEGDEEAAVKVAKKVIDEGLNHVDVINKGYTAGMHRVGDPFDKEEIPLPAVLVAAEAMTRAIEILGPHIPKGEVTKKTGKIVLGTIEGDIYGIGMRIVATMFRVSGFDVTDKHLWVVVS
jgi:methanogenic corrinoid protein MtbC1